MIERILFLFLFIMILLLICFAALMCIIEEASDDDNGRDKKVYKKNEGVKKDL